MAVTRAGRGISTLLKTAASTAIDSTKKGLRDLSNELWRTPELGFKEYKAHKLLTDFLEKEGFRVERSYTGLETAFKATFGSGRPNVCVICEYDALPEIGHACGHNLIAEAGVAAGLGVKAAMEEAVRSSDSGSLGTVTIMGTPAEEGGGGKVMLINNGAFEGIDVAMMVHPSPYSCLMPGFLAVVFLKVVYRGREAHAAAYPWEGLNALDAAVLAYNSISVLRQQMKPTWRVHSVITEGGVKANIIPSKSVVELMVRSPNREELKGLVKKVSSCLKGAGDAAGVETVITETAPQYDDLVSNTVLAKLFKSNWSCFGVDAAEYHSGSGSTDMGNVSYAVPSLHPKFEMGTGEGIHTREFAASANTNGAHDNTLVVGKVMAHTCIDVLTTEGLLEEIQVAFEKSKSQN